MTIRPGRIGAAAAALLAGLALMAAGLGVPSGKGTTVSGKRKAPFAAGSVVRMSLADHECNHFGSLSCPSSSSSGELSSTDCRLDDGSYLDLVQFAGTAGQTVTIDLTSAAFDSYLYLLDPTPVVVASNDDFELSTDSRIVFTLTRSGTWTIGAASLGANQFGSYSLTIQCTSAPITTPTPPGVPPPTPTPVGGPCVPNATTLCLSSGRFRVQATFASPQGQAGIATAISETSDTGTFWFFTPNNLEAIVKVVNGCTFNQRYWVFAAGLTNVAVTMTVTDTATGSVRTYKNPQGTPFAPIQDTNAFATCP